MPDGALPAVFVLLDDGQAGEQARSRLYTDFVEELSCVDVAALDVFWVQVESRLSAGLSAVLMADYEWGVALQRLPDPRARPQSLDHHQPAASRRGSASGRRLADKLQSPALRVLLFRSRRMLTAAEVEDWLVGTEDGVALSAVSAASSSAAGIADLRQSVSAEAFADALERIHAALEAGDCYQINYTFRLAFSVFGSPVSLYRQLRARQPAPFGALIRTDRGWTLSASPELFIRHQAGRLLAKPMKGTAARDTDPVRDAQRGAALAADPKNRAENVMIVDLLRNDLGRIAPPGTVSVSSLFSVEAWPTIWQMTSTVEAVLPRATGFPEVLRALFPCGSITGAPKRAAIDLIESLESTPRGLYSGAIGWIDAVEAGTAPRVCGDFCLSVAIRTINIAPHLIDGVRPASAGIGAGIVLDSRAVDEYEECLLKARFLTAADPGFALFETMVASRDGAPNRHRHLARLSASASRLGFLYDTARINAALDKAIGAIATAGAYRLKLSLAKDGTVVCASAPLGALQRGLRGGSRSGLQGGPSSDREGGPEIDPESGTESGPQGSGGPVDVLLGREHGFADTHADDFLLRFKTTHRADYDRGWQQAEREGAFDMIFANTDGWVTEGGRSNLFVKLAGRWYTPPVSDGLLPGVMRAIVLEDPDWNVVERSLHIDELFDAEALALSNGLRGIIPARLRTRLRTYVPDPENCRP